MYGKNKNKDWGIEHLLPKIKQLAIDGTVDEIVISGNPTLSPPMPWLLLDDSDSKDLPTMRETWFWSLGQEDLLEKVMATHSSILAWRIQWTEEPGELQSMESQRVRHNWVSKTLTSNNFNMNHTLIIPLLLKENRICHLIPPLGLDEDDEILKRFVNPFPPMYPSIHYKLNIFYLLPVMLHKYFTFCLQCSMNALSLIAINVYESGIKLGNFLILNNSYKPSLF